MSVSEAVLAIDMSKSKKGRLPSFTELCDGKVGLIRTSCIYFGELKLCWTAVFFFFCSDMKVVCIVDSWGRAQPQGGEPKVSTTSAGTLHESRQMALCVIQKVCRR